LLSTLLRAGRAAQHCPTRIRALSNAPGNRERQAVAASLFRGMTRVPGTRRIEPARGCSCLSPSVRPAHSRACPGLAAGGRPDGSHPSPPWHGGETSGDSGAEARTPRAGRRLALLLHDDGRAPTFHARRARLASSHSLQES
jgi:hypothetical protein